MDAGIAPLDPTDVATMDEVQALRVAVDAADLPDLPPPCPYAFYGELTHPVSFKRREGFVARVDGAVVGYLTMVMPLRDNLDNAEAEIVVHPAHRRRGIGRALYTHQVARMRELGRKRWTSMTVEALPGGPPRDGAGRGFAATVGAAAALEDVRRRLDLTTADGPALAAAFEAARARATGYRVVTWRGATPEEYLADADYLDGRLVSDAPMGDLVVEPPEADLARRREDEQLRLAGGWRIYTTGAVHEQTGRLVAVTVLGGQRSSPWHAYQWLTLVDPDHRGHRLGMLLKVANLRFAREHQPELWAVDTWNAAVNRHMIAINEAIGFRPVDAWVNWQQEI